MEKSGVRKEYKALIPFTIWAYLGLFLSATALAAPEAPFSLDAHVHFDERLDAKKPGHKEFLKTGMFRHAILISPSYAYWSGRESDEGFEYLGDESLILGVNKQVSDFIQQHAGQFIGACGLNLRWRSPLQFLTPCLNLPGMKGIKIHSEDSGVQVNKPENFAKISAVFDKVRTQRPFVLWHLATNDEEYKSSESALKTELAAVYRLAKNYPEITFILAHSLYSAKAIQLWRQWEDTEPLSNVYLEISTYYANIALSLEDDLVAAWRAFGMSRVLFGSDLSNDYLDANEHKQFTSVLQNAVAKGQLSNHELKLILDENGERLFQQLSTGGRRPDSANPRSYFDAHIHLADGYHQEIPFTENHADKMTEIYSYEIGTLIANEGLIGGFLLTPTYLDGWARSSMENIINENIMITHLLRQKLPRGKEFRVLCGVNIYDSRAVEIAAKCLSLQGIHGLKIRFNPIASLPPTFAQIMAIANSAGATVLVHFSGPHKPDEGNEFSHKIVHGLPDQVQKILEIMRQSPEATLVIAHSGMDNTIGIDGLKTIGAFFRSNPKLKRNIYSDISFGFRQAGISGLSDPNYKKLVNAWKVFGIDYLFFGSDTYRRTLERGGLPFLINFLRKDSIDVQEIPNLDQKDKEKIFKGNFLNFLK